MEKQSITSENMDLRSMDIGAENRTKLKQLFPSSKSGPVLNPMLRKMRSQNSSNCISTTSTPTRPRKISFMKAGFMLTEKVEARKLAGKTIYSVADGALLICLENEITRALIDAVAEAEHKQFICLDRGFQGNDQLKANAVQTFTARNRSKENADQIVFRTV